MGTTQIRVGIIIPIAIPGQPKASALKPVMEPSEPWTIDWSRKPDASTDDQRTPKPMLSIPTCEPMSAEAEPIMVAEPEPMMFASRKAMLSHCECSGSLRSSLGSPRFRQAHDHGPAPSAHRDVAAFP